MIAFLMGSAALKSGSAAVNGIISGGYFPHWFALCFRRRSNLISSSLKLLMHILYDTGIRYLG